MVRSAIPPFTPPTPTHTAEIDRRTLLKLAGSSAVYLSWLGCGGPSIPLQTEGRVIVIGGGGGAGGGGGGTHPRRRSWQP
jgi:hypothetical protein